MTMRLRHILISLLTMLAVIPATAGMFSRSDPVITADPAAVKGASLQPYKYNGKEYAYCANNGISKKDEETYKSEITHQEPEGEGARGRILDYEKDRANSLREELQTDNKHQRP